MLLLIQRFTTRYSETEDRILLQVELTVDSTATLWLSLRFLIRLIPVLIQQIDKSEERDAHFAMLQHFNQQLAISSLKPSANVKISDNNLSFLVVSADVQRNEESVRIIFRLEDREYFLILNNTELRQWLWIIYKAFQSAEWPLNLWPSWFQGEMVASDQMH